MNDKHHWSSFYGGWPAEIVRDMFDRLPPGYQAGPRVYLGSSFEVDVSMTEADDCNLVTTDAMEEPYTIVADFNSLDEYEVRVYDSEREQTLVAVIEIVSPSNKDRPETRAQFIGKVAALLREGVCVSIVDVVSDRHTNFYAELLERIGQLDPRVGADPSAMYAVTLRARRRRKNPALLDAWYFPMAVGEPLPTIPLCLSPNLQVMLPLEPSYSETCRLLRIT